MVAVNPCAAQEREAPHCGQRHRPRPVPLALLPHSLRSQPRSERGDGPFVYLLINADGEDIPVPQRLLTEHQAVVELLDRLVAPGGSIRVGQADQLSAARMQLRRHLQWAASFYDNLLCDSYVMAAE